MPQYLLRLELAADGRSTSYTFPSPAGAVWKFLVDGEEVAFVSTVDGGECTVDTRRGGYGDPLPAGSVIEVFEFVDD